MRTKLIFFVIAAILVAATLFVMSRKPAALAPDSYAERMQECNAAASGSIKVSDTTRMTINLPKDLYPTKQLETIENGATAGYISNAGLYGEAQGASALPNCWSYYFEFDLAPENSASSGVVELRSKGATPNVPDFVLDVTVERTK